MKRLIATLVPLIVAVGCAHQQPAPTETVERTPTPPTPPAPVVKVAPAPTPDLPTGREDLEAAIRTATIRFDFDAATLKPESIDALQRIGSVLKKHPNLKVRVEGNCDERGTTEYNMMLGSRRAGVARKYLTDLGVQVAQVDDISYGAEKPVDPRHSEDAWAANRRDDVRLGDK